MALSLEYYKSHRWGPTIKEANIEKAKELIKKRSYEKNKKTNDKIEAEVKIKNQVDEINSTLKDPNLFNRITIEEFDKKIVGEIRNRQAVFLYTCGTLVENHAIASYNLCADSSSGAGKDYTLNAVVTYWPEVTNAANPKNRGYVKRTRISPTVLNYWHCEEREPDWTWDGKICYLPDVSGSVLNHEVFKVFSSDGSVATITINGKAVDITIHGKPVVFTTTATTKPNIENLRRMPRITMDETIDQSKAIVKRQAEYAAIGKTLEYDINIREALSYLKRVKVKIPFAMELVDLLPVDNIIVRTHFPRFLDLIKASAALHQFQRESDDGFILAEAPVDYENARNALNQTTTNSLMIPTTRRQQRLIEIIKGSYNDGWFTVSELEPKVEFISEKRLYEELAHLSELGFFDRDKELREDSKKPVMVYRLRKLDVHFLPPWGDIVQKST